MRGVLALMVALALASTPRAAHADYTQGTTCLGTAAAGISGSTNGASLVQPAGGNNLVCVSGTWQYPAYQFGSTSASCNSTNAGTMQWTGSVLKYCDGSNWQTVLHP